MTLLFVSHVETIIVLLQLEIGELGVFGGVEEDCCCGSVLRGMEGKKIGCRKGGKGVA